MESENWKLVDFTKCESCKHRNVPTNEQPCDECLSEPARLYSTTPAKYEKE